MDLEALILMMGYGDEAASCITTISLTALYIFAEREGLPKIRIHDLRGNTFRKNDANIKEK